MWGRGADGAILHCPDQDQQYKVVMGWWIVAMLSWLAGVWLQVSQAEVSGRAVTWGVACLSLAVLVGSIRFRDRKWAPWCVLALIGLAWASTNWRAAQRLDEQVPAMWAGKPVQAHLQVDSMVQSQPGATFFEAQVLAWRSPGAEPWSTPDQFDSGRWPRRVAVRLNGGEVVPQPGQRWHMTVRLHEPDGLANPGGFDVALYHWERGVRAMASAKGQDAQLVSLTPQWFWQGRIDKLRTWIRDRIRAQVPETRWAGVLSGLAVGDQSSIERQDWDVFRQTGVAHLVSISGGHVAMFGWLAAWLIQPLWLRSGRLAWQIPSPDAARIGAVVAATLYALLAGWGVPAQRTVIMMAVFAALRVSGRRWPWPMTWLLAAVVVTAWDPWSLYQAGFWLSFVAVGVLMTMTPEPDLKTARRWWPQLQHLAGQLWSTQWRVTVALLPLSCVFFQQASLMGLPANLFAIPVFTVLITPLALLGVLIPWLWSVGASVIEFTVRLLTYLAQSPMVMWDAPLLPSWLAICVVLAGATLIWPMRAAWRWTLLPFLLPLWCLPSAWRVWPAPEVGQFTVLAADVGQGSAVLVQTATHTLLFDAGPQIGAQQDAGAKVLVPLFRTLGWSRLDVMMISHGDTDHIGGAQSVLNAMPVGQLWSPLSSDHALRQSPSANGRVPEHRDCEAGRSWVWDGVVFKVLRPDAADLAQRDHLSDNALSCVLQIQSAPPARSRDKAVRVALLTGDIEAEQEAALVEQEGVGKLKADLLVVPHHGSKTSSTQAFLEAVQPRQSVIQVGRRNAYGHPSPSVLKRYAQMGLPWVATPQCGAFMWRSEDADEPNGQCWRSMRPHYWQAAG